MSERLTPQNKYLEYLGLDEDDYIDLRINDQVVKQQSVGQIQKWNREGRICTSTGSKMNPESHKLIQQRLLRTGFQYDPQDAPRASNYIPPFSTEKNNVSQVDQTKVRLPIPGTPVVTHPIQTLDISEANYRQKTLENLIQKRKPKVSRKLQEEWTEAEMDISKADDRQKTLENLTQKRKPQRLRKLQELCTEAKMDDWNNPSSQLKRGQGNNAVNRRAVESPASFGPSMDGENNTQLVINGTINGTFNYAHQSGNSGMMHFVYLAVIIALLGYLMLRG